MAAPRSPVSLRQLRAFVAVYEEGSFTRAARRENATQSGTSQHVAALEDLLGAQLLARTPAGVLPTPAGDGFYARAIEALRTLDLGAAEVRARSGGVTGRVRAGLMPAFTRAALAPALERFAEAHPHVTVEVIEGYSGALSEQVRAGDLDFALVPAGADLSGLAASHLVTNREMLVSGAGAGLDHLVPVRLTDLDPLALVVPGRANIRRARLETHLETHGVRVARLLEMDSMLGTLELVARGHWMAILPGIICAADACGRDRHVLPITAPELYSDFITIEPARAALSAQAGLFLDALRSEILRLADFGNA